MKLRMGSKTTERVVFANKLLFVADTCTFGLYSFRIVDIAGLCTQWGLSTF